MIDRYLLKLKAHLDLSPEEEAATRASIGLARPVPKDEIVVHAGRPLTACTLLLDGIMACFKDMHDGGRQITQFHVPGDVVDLHGFTLKRLDHGVIALSACRAATIPHDALTRISDDFPRLTRLYWFTGNLDAAVHREWQLSLGQRDALARLANMFCELRLRLRAVGIGDAAGYPLPLTQADIAECAGLTPIHVNRTLKELRERGLVHFKGGRATILDWDGLKAAAEFDPAFLYLDAKVT